MFLSLKRFSNAKEYVMVNFPNLIKPKNSIFTKFWKLDEFEGLVSKLCKRIE